MQNAKLRAMPYAHFPLATAIVAAILCGLFAAILPTCLHRYVEPRGRLSWGTPGDSRGARRAPFLLRSTAWLSFALGQLALPCLLVPAGCAGLLYLQTKLGVAHPLGVAATIAFGTTALFQSLLACRLLPLGVRLLMRDARLEKSLARLAKTNAMASGLLLAMGAVLSLVMRAVPGSVHPWLRAALVWSAVRPVILCAFLFLLHALMLDRCAVVLAQSSRPKR
jgi:hypothetical protein